MGIDSKSEARGADSPPAGAESYGCCNAVVGSVIAAVVVAAPVVVKALVWMWVEGCVEGGL